MKLAYLTIIGGLLFAAPVLGLTFLGTPTTVLKTGEITAGASYANSDQDIEIESEDLGGARIDGVKEESVIGHVGVGVADERLELFGLFGAANLKQDDIKANGEFLAGVGTRITMYKGDDGLDWGIVAQFTWFTDEDKVVVDGFRTPFELNVFDVQVGLGPCWRPGPFILYGGLMIDWITGNIDVRDVGSFDVQAESNFGAYFGAGIDLAKHISAVAEIQGTPDSSAWGGSVMWRF